MTELSTNHNLILEAFGKVVNAGKVNVLLFYNANVLNLVHAKNNEHALIMFQAIFWVPVRLSLFSHVFPQKLLFCIFLPVKMQGNHNSGALRFCMFFASY